MKKTIFSLLIAALLLIGCSPAGTTIQPPEPPPAAPVQPQPQPPAPQPPAPQPQPQPPAPAATQTYAPPPPPAATTASSCLSIAQFKAMWTASTPAQGPGPLISALNTAWDAKGISKYVSAIGEGWEVGSHTVQPMSLVWTDLLGQSPTVPPGTGKWVPLRTQGGWGVFAAYDTVVVPTPGRSAKMCESLNPARDLAGW